MADKVYVAYSNSDLFDEIVVNDEVDTQPVDIVDVVFYSAKMSSAEICAALDRLKMAVIQGLVRR